MIKEMKKFEQVFWRRLVSWYAEWIGMAKDEREHLGSFVQWNRLNMREP